MLQPKITPLHFTYKKPNTDVWVLNFDDIPVDVSLVRDRQIVNLGPGSVGGNHTHPRTEWFVGLGALVFVWLDETGKKHQQPMQPEGELLLIEVPPHLPHAVVNPSAVAPGVLFELADAKMADVVPVAVA